MKGKIIYVDFTSKTKKVTYTEAPSNKGFWPGFLAIFKRLFRCPEIQNRHKQDIYNFKRMV